MKLRDILTLFTLSVIVKGAWWAAAVQPVILGLGAMYTAIDLDVIDVQPILQPFVSQLRIRRKLTEKEERFKKIDDEKPLPVIKEELWDMRKDFMDDPENSTREERR